ncbi:hypothetical protein MFIFM68171_02785 [Madurella fahalii]|uniref:Uncharacterized protein n=1 Tax=Madurella fahalii TaxID=1157608 RepID=A0ABQ0G484_9PEZI
MGATRNGAVNASVGIIMLTSAEFRDTIARIARLIPESKDKSVKLESGFGTLMSYLVIPSLMGLNQRFPVDLTVLYPGNTEVMNIGVFSISSTQLLLAALRACLRSAFLETSLDSTPLFEAYMAMTDITRMG